MGQELIVLAAITPWLHKPLQLAAVVLGVGFLVFVHELGHFLVAKMQGVRVERFAIGLGRKLVGFTWAGTEYALCAIPFGGYVKMAGEYPNQERKGADYEFYSKSPGRRAQIVLAGVVMNAIVGILIFIGAFRMGVLLNSPEIEPTPGGPAWVAGQREGDVILEANGIKINSLTDLAHVVMVSEGDVALKVQRGDETFVENVVPERDPDLGIRTIGVSTRAAMTIGAVLMARENLLRAEDVTDWQGLCLGLIEAAEGGPSPAGRVWSLLSPESKAAVRAVREGLSGADRDTIVQGMNDVLTRWDFYDPESFAGVALPEDVREATAGGMGRLGVRDVLRINRQLLALCFPGSLAGESGPAKGEILKGDVIQAAGGGELVSWTHFRRIVKESPGKPLEIRLLRKTPEGDSVVTVAAVPMPLGGWSAGCVSGNDLYVDSVRKGTAAWRAGIKAGDRIVALNGAPTGGGDRFRSQVAASGGKSIVLGIDRDGSGHRFELTPELDPAEGRALIGVMFRIEPVVGKVLPDSPAEKTGLRPGDRIVSLKLQGFDEEIEIRTWSQFGALINNSEGKSVRVAWRRDNKTLGGRLVARHDAARSFGHLGLGPEMKLKRIRLGLLESVVYGIRNSYAMGKRVIGTIYGLLSFQVSPKVVAGPVLLPFMGMWFVERGFGTFLYFLGMIGINFAIVNLLPLPVVDGGVLVLIGLEKVRGRPLSLKSQTIIQQVGVAILIAIFLLITIQDVGRLSSLFGG